MCSSDTVTTPPTLSPTVTPTSDPLRHSHRLPHTRPGDRANLHPSNLHPLTCSVGCCCSCHLEPAEGLGSDRHRRMSWLGGTTSVMGLECAVCTGIRCGSSSTVVSALTACASDTERTQSRGGSPVWSFSHRGFLTLESVMPDCPERPQCLRLAWFGLCPL